MTTDSTRAPGVMISPAAYGALSEALTAIIWNKKPFEVYIRRVLRGRPELLTGLNFNEVKAKVSDELIDQLMADEDRYQAFTMALMNEIADMESFPNLERQPNDRALHLDRAHKAVANLRRFVVKYNGEQQGTQQLAEELAELREQVQERRDFATTLNELKNEYLILTAATNTKQRGLDFEPFLYRLFRLFDLQPRLSYSLEHKQIDGSMTFDTDDYIIEAKWLKGAAEHKDVSYFASKVGEKSKNTLGLFVSVNGFSKGARETYRTRTVFITFDGEDLFFVLDGRIRLDELLRFKKRHASETGSCYFPVREILAQD